MHLVDRHRQCDDNAEGRCQWGLRAFGPWGLRKQSQESYRHVIQGRAEFSGSEGLKD